MRRNWPDEVESRSGANNPKGIATSSPRLRGTSYLGKTSKQNDNRNAVAAMSRGSCSIELFRDTAEIRVERVARGFVAQKRTTVFGGEAEMNVNGGKGLWHVERMVSRVLVCQSQRIASIRRRLARRLRPWVGVRKEPQRQRRCGRAQVRGRNARVATALRLGRFLADDPG